MKYLKYLPWAVLFLAIAGVAIWQWRVSVSYQELLNARTTELQQAKLEVGKAHTQIMEQDQVHKKAIADLDSKLQAEIKKHNELVTMYARLEASYNTERKQGESLMDLVEKLRAASSIADLEAGKLFYKREDGTLTEVVSLKWSWNDFRLDLEGSVDPEGLNSDQTLKIKHTVSYGIHMKLKAQLIETQLPNRVTNYYAKLYELDDKGTSIGELPLTSFEVVKSEVLPSKMMWWNPHLDLMVGGGFTTTKKPAGLWTGEIGMSFMGYGKTENDLSWRFLRLGMGVSDSDLSLSFSPGQWNMGGPIPLVSNLYITPTIGYSLRYNSIYAGGGLSVVF